MTERIQKTIYQTIITHQNVDLDAVSSVWAVKTFVPGAKNADVRFEFADFDQINSNEFCVDITAGVKGETDTKGNVHSAFKEIVNKYASKEDQIILSKLLKFIDTQDAFGMVVERIAPETTHIAQEILTHVSLAYVVHSLKRFHHDDQIVTERFGEILDGYLDNGRVRLKAEIEVDKIDILANGQFAVTENPGEMVTNVLFERGVKVVLYIDKYNIGITRSPLDRVFRVDLPEIKKIVKEAGEEDEWFNHPAGFLYCRGSRKNPARTPSKVDPKKLKAVMIKALSKEK